MTKDFHTYSDIIKNVGNQGAYPDEDPALVDMSMQDAGDIYALFSEIIIELFSKPAVIKRVRDRVVANRKL